MGARIWRDTLEDPDRKRRRQAEFLVYQQFPVTLIKELAVFNGAMRQRCNEILDRAGLRLTVSVRRGWYF
jgi:hypothetical protein